MTADVRGYPALMAAESALVRMLRAGTDEGRDLAKALEGLAQVFGHPGSAQRIGRHVTCEEANRIAFALLASRHTEAAIVWLDGHAASDTEDDRHGRPGFDAVRYVTGRSR
jgi:hypothetical protein